MEIELKDLIGYGASFVTVLIGWNKTNNKHERLEDKMKALEEKHNSITATMENIIKTNQTLMNAVTELNVHTSDFANRAQDNWTRNDKNFEKIFAKFESLDEGIKKFYRDNSQFKVSED